MFKNYLKIALRNSWKFKAHSLINVFGLAFGIACCILILLYVGDELSYDRYHEKSGRIFRVVLDLGSPAGVNALASTPAALAPTLTNDLPQIEQAVRFYKYFGGASVRYGNTRLHEESFFFADPSVFDVFSFQLLEGNPETALHGPFKIAISESAAKKYFGGANPVGEQFVVNDTLRFHITGVMGDLPEQSHFRFDFLASFSSWESMVPSLVNTWAPHMYYTYLLLPANTSPKELEAKLPDVVDRNTNLSAGWSFTFLLQPLTDIHLLSHREAELEANGNQAQLYIFAGVALLILLIACINFMNLSTARSANRAREIGMRKVFGAERRQLIGQFWGEAVVLSFVAASLALVLAEFMLPFLNRIANKSLTLGAVVSGYSAFALVALVIVVGVVAGSYPALFLSNLKIVNVLMGSKGATRRHWASFVRKGLVVFQFAISIGLIFGTILAFKQLDYMRNQDLGFKSEQIVVVPVRNIPQPQQKLETFKTQLLQNTSVLNVTASNNVPGRGAILLSYRTEDMPENEWRTMNVQFVEPDFVETYRMEIIAGRDFSNDLSDQGTFILNEAAVSKVGWQGEQALGKRFALRRGEGRVIGVVKDFNYVSLHQEVDPLVLVPTPFAFRNAGVYVSLRIGADDLSATVTLVKETWRSVFPNRPFEYFFLDVDSDRQYRAEEKFAQLFTAFSGVAILIACLGLLGLTSYTTEQRTKEIGIRKVLGATIANVTALLSKDFVKLVLMGNLLAWPVAYFAMNKWLQNFAYRIDSSWWIFALAGGLGLVIALLTVSSQAIRAALANPVESLRYE